MHTIEVDFDVLKALMARRETEDVTNNDVLRRLLQLGPASNKTADFAPRTIRNVPTNDDAAETPPSGDWLVKGVRFPAGTEFRARHAGRTINAQVQSGGLVLGDKLYHSPSHAASDGVTGYNVNGWRFWECRLPGQTAWALIQQYRTD
jgi:hypothetical protein